MASEKPSINDSRGIPPRLSFEIDDRVTVRLDFQLAIELAELVLKGRTENRALFAFAKELEKLAERQ